MSSTSVTFADLGLSESVVKAVTAAGYTVPTPIQAQAIPIVATGRDLLGVAQTGTGKTAAFALPIIHRLLTNRIDPPVRDQRREATDANERPSRNARRIRVLVLAPTRELAGQIAQSFATYSAGTPLRHTVVFGGVNQYHQVKALRAGADILVATPGRLMDLREQGFIDFSHVQMLVLDEADRMLDMGFLPQVRRIVHMLPTDRQTLFFSATMPPEVRDLANSILRNPARIEITPVATTADNIAQSVFFIDKPNKLRLLRHLLKQPAFTRTLVFTKTKHTADKLARQLDEGGFSVEAIHGNRTQGQRTRALMNFKCGRATVLIATDIASRGIDVDGISHVINFDLPLEPDNYVHRIGRTARAGASGIAVSFCSPEERGLLKSIERLIRQYLEVRHDLPPFVPETAPAREQAAGANGRPMFGRDSQQQDDDVDEFGEGVGESIRSGESGSDGSVAPRRFATNAGADPRPQQRRPSSQRPARPFKREERSGTGVSHHGSGNGAKGPPRFGKPARESRFGASRSRDR